MGGVRGNIDTGPVEDGEDIPPGVVEILRDEGAVRVEDAVDRPDGVPEIEVVGAVQREALEFLIAAVVEIQHVAAGLDSEQIDSVLYDLSRIGQNHPLELIKSTFLLE